MLQESFVKSTKEYPQVETTIKTRKRSPKSALLLFQYIHALIKKFAVKRVVFDMATGGLFHERCALLIQI